MSGCPDCEKRSRWWLWVIPAILIAVGLLQLLRCGDELDAVPGTRVSSSSIHVNVDRAHHRNPP